MMSDSAAGGCQYTSDNLWRRPAVRPVINVKDDRQSSGVCQIKGPEGCGAGGLCGKHGASRDQCVELAEIHNLGIGNRHLEVCGTIAVDDGLVAFHAAFIQGQRSARFAADRQYMGRINALVMQLADTEPTHRIIRYTSHQGRSATQFDKARSGVGR